jgi:Xaa-Pro aminopeptidase
MGFNKADKVYGLEKQLKGGRSQYRRQYLCTSALLIISLFSLLVYQERIFDFLRIGSMRDRVQKCSICNFKKSLYFLENSKPITASEFIERRNRLARALNASGVDAFVLEPGYSFQYYGNISQIDWEPWEPEERPFLMVVKPVLNRTTGIVEAETTFLSPAFEAGRVRMLGIPSTEDLRIIEWEEQFNPYETLKKNLFSEKDHIMIMVDEEMRDFIVRGLDANGFETQGLNMEVDMVRQVKSPAEIENLRAVNTGTVEAIRAMRPCLKPGLTEREVITILDNTLLSVGFDLFFNIVLFDSNAALPHGGFETGGEVLEYDTMVLIDVG